MTYSIVAARAVIGTATIAVTALATLHILNIPNIAQDVKTLKVFFKADVSSAYGEETRERQHILEPKDIKPDSFVDDPEVVTLAESGTVSCRCEFSMDSGIVNSDEIDHEKVEDEPLPEFKLSRDENDNPIVT